MRQKIEAKTEAKNWRKKLKYKSWSKGLIKILDIEGFMMEKEVYLTFDDHEDFRRAVEETLQDKKELSGMLARA